MFLTEEVSPEHTVKRLLMAHHLLVGEGTNDDPHFRHRPPTDVNFSRRSFSSDELVGDLLHAVKLNTAAESG